jgi:hypothetical protein
MMTSLGLRFVDGEPTLPRLPQPDAGRRRPAGLLTRLSGWRRRDADDRLVVVTNPRRPAPLVIDLGA